ERRRRRGRPKRTRKARPKKNRASPAWTAVVAAPPVAGSIGRGIGAEDFAASGGVGELAGGVAASSTGVPGADPPPSGEKTPVSGDPVPAAGVEDGGADTPDPPTGGMAGGTGGDA